MEVDVTRIPLRRRDGSVRAFALIDSADLELVESNGPWHFAQGYAKNNRRIGPRSENQIVITPMQRLLLGLAPSDDRLVDHINRDKLDNRRSNLRIADAAVNAQNPSARRGGTSPYRGVCWNCRTEKWVATVQIAGSVAFRQSFDDESAAANAARDFRLANMPGAVD